MSTIAGAPQDRTPLAALVLAPPAVVSLLAGGLLLWSGVVVSGYDASIVVGVLWFIAAAVALGRLTRSRPRLRRVVRATVALCSVAAIAGFYVTSVRETTVSEEVVTGVPASELP